MRLLVKLPLLAAFGVVLACAGAPPPPALSPDEARIESLLASQHVPDFLERLEQAALRSAGHPRDGHLPEDQRLRARIETQLDPAATSLDIARRAARAVDAASLAEVERFYAAPTGRDVLRANGAPYSWFSRLGYRLFGRRAAHPQERVALAERLYAATGMREATRDLYVRVYEAEVRWYEARGMIDPDEAESVGGIDALIANEREAVDTVSQRHAVPFTLYAYSDLSDAELLELATHLESEAGRAYTKAVREAMAGAIEERAAAISR